MLKHRLKNLNDEFTKVLYNNICRSLFEKDKLLFSFLLCVRILQVSGDINGLELRYFLTGNTSVELAKPNPLPDSWLSEKAWGDILGAADFIEGLDTTLEARPDDFKKIFDSPDPKGSIVSLFNEMFDGKFNSLQVLIALRCLRPDKVVPALQEFIAEKIGSQFDEPPPFDLHELASTTLHQPHRCFSF